MTYDVTLKKNGRIFPTPLTICGMSYGSSSFDWANEFIFSYKEMKLKEIKIKFKKFHMLFNKYCKSITHNGKSNYYGSDATGYYYKTTRSDIEIQEFKTTLRWLQIYAVAVAFGCDIEFR